MKNYKLLPGMMMQVKEPCIICCNKQEHPQDAMCCLCLMHESAQRKGTADLQLLHTHVTNSITATQWFCPS